MRQVVCISHATGAGGSEIGQRVAEQLGYRYIDEDLVVRAAMDGGIDVDTLADEERRKSWLSRALGELARGAPSGVVSASSGELQELIRTAIQETAAEGRTVIVAHAASHALGGREDVLRVFVTASPDTRAARLRRSERLDESAAVRTVKDEDAARASYLRRFHDVGREQPTQYDLVLNTDQLSVDQAAELVSVAATG
ncbi:MAG TPA: cytidylate kinase-like family protein [Gaiellaceae bacterium]